jgi:hypothetical protein
MTRQKLSVFCRIDVCLHLGFSWCNLFCSHMLHQNPYNWDSLNSFHLVLLEIILYGVFQKVIKAVGETS